MLAGRVEVLKIREYLCHRRPGPRRTGLYTKRPRSRS
jgi:hypothetical protein